MFHTGLFTVLQANDQHRHGSGHRGRLTHPEKARNAVLSNLWFRKSTTNLLFFCFSTLWSKDETVIHPRSQGWMVLWEDALSKKLLLPIQPFAHELFISLIIAPTFPQPGAKQSDWGLVFLGNTGNGSGDFIFSATPRKATVLKMFVQYIFGLHSRELLRPGWSVPSQRSVVSDKAQ